MDDNTFPLRTIFWLPQSTDCLLTLFPDAWKWDFVMNMIQQSNNHIWVCEIDRLLALCRDPSTSHLLFVFIFAASINHQLTKQDWSNRRNSISNVWIAGDFNCPKIDLTSLTCTLNDKAFTNLLDLTRDFHHHQAVEESTRGKNILNVFVTTNPLPHRKHA